MKGRKLLIVIATLLVIVIFMLIWSPWKKETETQNGSGLIRVGIINLDPSESGYRKANVRDMVDTFTAGNGYEASFVTASTVKEQLEAADQLVNDRVKYLLISAADADGWNEALTKAKNAGVRVFLFDRMISTSPDLYTAAVVSDMNREGSAAVAWLEKQDLEEYRVLHIKGQPGSAAQLGRSGALEAKCAEEENWTIVRAGTGGDNWDPEEARKITQAAMDAGDKFNVIYAENDDMANAAVEVLDANGITHGVNGDVIVMGFDCNKWALRKLLAGEWNYDGQCSPFQAGLIDEMIKKLEAGGKITGLNDLDQMIIEEKGFEAGTITQEEIDYYGLGD